MAAATGNTTRLSSCLIGNICAAEQITPELRERLSGMLMTRVQSSRRGWERPARASGKVARPLGRARPRCEERSEERSVGEQLRVRSK
eukprot:1803832-Pleurochrysis_carterae.AAC.1